MKAAASDREAFIAANVGLVHTCAHRFRGRGIEYDDLFQAGCLGLVKACDAFDTARGVMFSTYAVPVILGEIKKLFRDGGTVKVSRQLKELSLRIAREADRYTALHGIEPTVSELAAAMGVEESRVVEAIGCARAPLSLTAEDDEDEGRTIDIATEPPEERITELLSLGEAISRLPEEDQIIVRLRFVESKTQAQTAAVLGTTQVQISRRERRLIKQLRLMMCD